MTWWQSRQAKTRSPNCVQSRTARCGMPRQWSPMTADSATPIPLAWPSLPLLSLRQDTAYGRSRNCRTTGRSEASPSTNALEASRTPKPVLHLPLRAACETISRPDSPHLPRLLSYFRVRPMGGRQRHLFPDRFRIPPPLPAQMQSGRGLKPTPFDFLASEAVFGERIVG